MKRITILLSLIVIGLGFAQDKGSFGVESQPMASRRIYIKHAERLALCDNTLPLNYYFIRAESETLQTKRSFWKQAGIYGLEFAGASVTTVSLSWLITWAAVISDRDKIMLYPYTMANGVFTGTATWIVGKLLSHKGSWLKSIVGAGIGSFVTGYLINQQWGDISTTEFIIFLAIPPLGATIGFNL